MATTYLQKVPSSVGSTTTATFSFWVKIAGTGTQAIYTVHDGSAQFDIFVRNASGQVDFYGYNGSSFDFRLHTSRLLRDHNAWYHIVCKVDLTNSTQADRAILYINGVRETAFSIETYPSNASATAIFSKNSTTTIGATHTGGSDLDGVLSHFHFCDGYAYDASTFGSTDATTGELKINTSPNVQYGTNGFFLFKDNASTTDQSGQGNNWSVTAGTLTKTEDNPSNNFATINPLQSFNSGGLDIDFANTRVRGDGSAWMRANAGLAAKSGKWYYEAYIQYTTSGRPIRLGWDSADNPNNGSDTYYSGFSISTDGYIRGGVNGYSGYDPNATALGVTFTTGDYIGLAIDIDGDTVTAYKNGTVISNVNALSLSGFTNCSIKKSRGHWITPSVVFYSVSNNDNRTEFNFGNGAFANTQLTGTTYTDSAGFGVFKYQPPTNYLAWCTKNLNQ